jgi:hypothetical protein
MGALGWGLIAVGCGVVFLDKFRTERFEHVLELRARLHDYSSACD